MSYCKECRHYVEHRVDGPTCMKGRPRPVSPIAKYDCFEERPGAGDAEVQSILASVPDNTVKKEARPAGRRAGRKKEHENYVDENGVLMKWCRMCRQFKPASEFYKKAGTPDGYAYDCKKCRTQVQKNYRDRKRANEVDMAQRLKKAEKLMEPDPDQVVNPEKEDRQVSVRDIDRATRVHNWAVNVAAPEQADLGEIEVAIRKFEVLNPIPGGLVEIVLLAKQEDMNATGLLPLAGKVLTVKFVVK